MSSAGSHQRLQEQEVGCASLSQGYGPAKRKATAAMTKGSKHNPWAQRVFLRTKVELVPCPEMSLELAAAPQVEGFRTQLRVPGAQGHAPSTA